MNEREEVLNKVLLIVKRVVTSYKGNHLEEQQRFVEDIGADSLDRVTLLIELEDSFGITITEEEAKYLVSAAHVVDLVLSHSGNPAGTITADAKRAIS